MVRTSNRSLYVVLNISQTSTIRTEDRGVEYYNLVECRPKLVEANLSRTIMLLLQYDACGFRGNNVRALAL